MFEHQDRAHEEFVFTPPPGSNRSVPAMTNSGICWSGALQQMAEHHEQLLARLSLVSRVPLVQRCRAQVLRKHDPKCVLREISSRRWERISARIRVACRPGIAESARPALGQVYFIHKRWIRRQALRREQHSVVIHNPGACTKYLLAIPFRVES